MPLKSKEEVAQACRAVAAKARSGAIKLGTTYAFTSDGPCCAIGFVSAELGLVPSDGMRAGDYEAPYDIFDDLTGEVGPGFGAGAVFGYNDTVMRPVLALVESREEAQRTVADRLDLVADVLEGKTDVEVLR